MDCWYCGGKLIWQSDHDLSDEEDAGGIMTTLICPKCGALVEYTLRDEVGE